MSMSYSYKNMKTDVESGENGMRRLIVSLYVRKDILDQELDQTAYGAAYEIMQKSISYSPVDEGHLEEAHHLVERSTRKGHPAYDVEVSGNESDLYAMWIHEGEYGLGPLSAAKAASSGLPVGRKYLERAFDEIRPQTVIKMKQIVKNFTRNK